MFTNISARYNSITTAVLRYCSSLADYFDGLPCAGPIKLYIQEVLYNWVIT